MHEEIALFRASFGALLRPVSRRDQGAGENRKHQEPTTGPYTRAAASLDAYAAVRRTLPAPQKVVVSQLWSSVSRRDLVGGEI